MITYDATYSPDDNKIRLYASQRLDKETYARIKDAGFKWAPKQDLFFAPMWTPARADIAEELAGSIGDEDTSLMDRAEDRADRFDEYQENRTRDAEQASEAVHQLTDNIPLGQPILIGHHSEKRARRDAKKIETGMQRAVKMWDTAAYWKGRAAGAIRHAKYKERPDVRVRRIKKIEAARRKAVKKVESAKMFSKMWRSVDSDKSSIKRKDGGKITTRERALFIASRDHFSKCFSLEEYPRTEHTYEGMQSVYSALKSEVITAEHAAELYLLAHENVINWHGRWVDHYDNRLVYEKALLEAQGASDLLKPIPRAKQPPLLNYDGPRTVKNLYHHNDPDTYTDPQHMTKADYSKICSDYKGTRLVLDGSHRVRVAMLHDNGRPTLNAVFLTDSKVHKKPEHKETKPEPAPLTMADRRPHRIPNPKPERTEADNMREALKAGVKTVSAPQLFATPPELCIKMAKLANFKPYHKALEPSAGTGNIIKAILGFTGFIDNSADTYLWNVELSAVEVNAELCNQLRRTFGNTEILNRNFLECDGSLIKFDRVLMNPPFKNADDIKHIKHALTFLKPGGRLVAICANGPRQQAALRPLAFDSGGTWETLPAGTFSTSGTMVNSALLTINKGS